MTLAQARALVMGSRGPNYQTAPTPGNGGLPPPPGSGGSNTTPDGFDPKTFGKNPKYNLPPGWVVNEQTGTLIPPGPDATGGAGIPMGNLFQQGAAVYRWNGRSITKATAAEARAYAADIQSGGDGNGGGSPGAGVGSSRIPLSDYQRAQIERQNRLDAQNAANTSAKNMAALAQNKATLAYNNRGQDESIINARMGSAQSLLTFLKGYADQQYKQSQDPWQYGAWLNNMASNSTGGDPAQSALFKGITVQPQADPNKAKIDGLIAFLEKQIAGTPTLTDAEAARQALENPATHDAAVTFLSQKPEDLARMFGGSAAGGSPTTAGAPPSSLPYGGLTADFAKQTQGASPDQVSALAALAQAGPDAIAAANAQAAANAAPPVPAYGRGGAMQTHGPAMLVDLSTGKPIALMGEKGDESLRITKHQPGQGTPPRAAESEMSRYASRPPSAMGAMAGPPRFAEGGDINVDPAQAMREAYAAFHPAGQDAGQAAAIDATNWGGASGGGGGGADSAQAERESGLRALAGFQNPDQVQQVLRDQQAQQAPQAAPQASGDPMAAAVNQYGQTPLSRAAMMLASHGLEGTVGGPAGDNGQAVGPYQIRMDVHGARINAADAADPMKSTEFMSNDYNLAAEKVLRENPGLYESDPARAAAMVAYYAEHPKFMYDERRYRDVYANLPKYESGGSISISGMAGTDPNTGVSDQNDQSGQAGYNNPSTDRPNTLPDGRNGGVLPTPNPGPSPMPNPPGGMGTIDPTALAQPNKEQPGGVVPTKPQSPSQPVGEAGVPLDQITGIKPTGAMASLASNPAVQTTTTQATAPSVASMATAAAPSVATGTATGVGGVQALAASSGWKIGDADPAIGWNNQLPTNTWKPPTNTPSTTMLNGHLMSLAEYVWIKTSQPNYMPGSTTEQKTAAATQEYNTDKYLIEGARQDAEKAYKQALAQWQGRENQHQRDLQAYQAWKNGQSGGGGGSGGGTGDGTQPLDVQAKALGNVLRPYNWVPPELLSYLDRGLAPPPGYVTDAFLAKLPPSVKAILAAVIKKQGTVRLDTDPTGVNWSSDYEASREQYAIPGMPGGLRVVSR